MHCEAGAVMWLAPAGWRAGVVRCGAARACNVQHTVALQQPPTALRRPPCGTPTACRTHTANVSTNIFRPYAGQATSEAERERMVEQAARALRQLHGDRLTPSPDSSPAVPPPVLAQPASQQLQRQVPAGQLLHPAQVPLQLPVVSNAYPPADPLDSDQTW